MLTKEKCCGWCGPRCLVFSFLALAYFVLFPEDLTALLAPLGPIVEFLRNALAISHAVSPWLYIVVAVAIAAWAVVRVWGPRRASGS
jgi:hypothetical protein